MTSVTGKDYTGRLPGDFPDLVNTILIDDEIVIDGKLQKA